MRLIVAGGGTGGHIYPALAVAQYMLETEQADVLYVGTQKGLENEIVPRSGIPFAVIPVRGWNRQFNWQMIRTSAMFVIGFLKSRKLLKSFRPDIVFGTGAYVSLSVILAARSLRIPTYIHEIEVLPGLANRLSARFADKIGLANERAEVHFARYRHKIEITGNPRASEGVRAATAEARRQALDGLGLDPNEPLVIIVSGSRGAKPINQAVIGMLEQWENSGAQLVFVTGSSHYEDVMSRVSSLPLSRVRIVPFVYRFIPLMACANLMVARSGASTVAEATALGVPAIYIPSPYVTNNHQEHNARWLEEEGAAIMIKESELTSDSLHDQILSLLRDPASLQSMRNHNERLGKPDALERIGKSLTGLSSNTTRGIIP